MIDKDTFYTVLAHKERIGEWIKSNIAFVDTDNDYRLWDVVDKDGKEIKPYTAKDWEQAYKETKGHIDSKYIISILKNNLKDLPFGQALLVSSIMQVLNGKDDYITQDYYNDIITHLIEHKIDTTALEQGIKELNPKWSK